MPQQCAVALQAALPIAQRVAHKAALVHGVRRGIGRQERGMRAAELDRGTAATDAALVEAHEVEAREQIEDERWKDANRLDIPAGAALVEEQAADAVGAIAGGFADQRQLDAWTVRPVVVHGHAGGGALEAVAAVLPVEMRHGCFHAVHGRRRRRGRCQRSKRNGGDQADERGGQASQQGTTDGRHRRSSYGRAQFAR
jgi:hypothetical protein